MASRRGFGQNWQPASTLAVKVVDDYVRPLIDVIADVGFREFVVVDVAACLYWAHTVSAIGEISALEHRLKDKAFENITWYYLLKQPSDEPVAPTDSALNKSDVDNIIECLKHIDTDHIFASIASRLCRSLNSDHGRIAFSSRERLEERHGRAVELER